MKLTDDQIREGITRLTDWHWDPDQPDIHRTVRLPDFVAAIDLVNTIAQAAEQVGHHPDIDIRYNKVRLSLTTHAVGAITENDMSLAARIDELVP
ncbi:4a-hydroxytetrahydrobiopterin dehydratase [Nocardiopsis sp. NRRL B-16309]|uniref:4a-hydroxytetrahydrobiopterin dehydratase n=1 Tax=Nocardiopsis sp. NRRL B-16309 TaxID=1519494 RepID=UPI0006AF4719|nr:4a-hydroxytetrahydrobiopterin dehydratase [Nocardiopsis sp. NRRL B-16309]KOX07909.1 pterin-4-alpha-carbinolamine dehydratase [Nocardiopsis sp. NRRL B-16309]